jgi:bifunctional non-homologous end joining protein LigD
VALKANRRRNPADRLEAYRRKRSAQATPEPFGGSASGPAARFVVQKHAARHLHFDLRLELDGVLRSWAVPKGPSLDPRVKRLAMQVEDHPLEYADFEGRIPEGNYGAGAVIVFDRGSWVSIGDPAEGLRAGKLLFDLRGYKLRGRWTLFRTKDGPRSWILMKKPDAWADAADALPQASVLSGLTVEQLRDGADPAAALRAELERRCAPRAEVDPRSIEPMLAQTAEAPFSRAGWLFEIKYDGYRLIAARRQGRPYLRYRRGQEATAAFPEVSAALGALPYDSLVLDGELVVLDEQGRPSFSLLQERVGFARAASSPAPAARPATLFAFDLLAAEGFDLRSLPLVRRKELLQRVVPALGPLCRAEHFEREGSLLFDEARKLGLEGIMAKRADSAYRSGRSADWLKIRSDRTGDFAIVGFTRPAGRAVGLAALHLAARAEAGLVYAGRVGTGFTARDLAALERRLESLRRKRPACAGEAPEGPDHAWVEPRLVCEVRYKERTAAGHLRHPVFQRLREDRSAEDCASLQPAPAPPPAVPRAAARPPAASGPREVPLTNLGKVFWPSERYTKGNLIEYYRAVSKWLLPYLDDRPVVLTRYPDGITGKSFFQKDAPQYVPSWIRTETMWSEHAEREVRYFVCQDVETLVYLANLGTIPLHVWSSRIRTLQHPDWCVLDLDPKDAPFAHVIRLARAIHALCRSIELPCFVKTSGSTGLHVLLPLGGQCTWEQSRQLGELLARVIVARHPDLATIARSVAAREGRVYLDFLQNGQGKLLVAPFSVRPLPGAPVSAPLAWAAVKPGLELGAFTIKTLPRLMARMRRDPWAGLLDLRPDLQAVLERLGERVEPAGGE